MVILSIVYFQAMLMSHLFFHFGTTSQLGLKRRMLKVSHYFMPLDHYPSYEYAYTYLDKGAGLENKELLAQGIDWFKTSLRINPFYYNSHYYLGKTYYFYHSPSGDFFSDTFASFKKAAIINGHDPDIVGDLANIAVPMWPLLPEEDKTFCLSLLKDNIDQLNDRDFKNLIAAFNRGSEGKELLRSIVKGKSSLFGKAADVLAEVGGSLNLRWELLAGFERYVFEEVHNHMRSLNFVENAREIEFVALLEQLNQVKGYDRLSGGASPQGGEIAELRSELMFKRIQAYLSEQTKPLGLRVKQKLYGLAYEYINRLDHYKILEELRRLLNEYSYFDATDIKTKYIGFLLDYKQGNFSKLITDIEKFKSRISLVNEKNREEYLKILLLLADSLEASKLLSVGNQTIQGILEIFPSEPAVVWRLAKVRRILGIDDREGLLDPNALAAIEDSRFFVLNNKPISRQAMLLDEAELFLSPAPDLNGAAVGNTLVRVFVDKSIATEFYLKDLNQPKKILIPGKEYSEVYVQIDFLVFNKSTVL